MSSSTISTSDIEAPTTTSGGFVNIADFHEYASKHLPKSVYDYYRSGAASEVTLKENSQVYNQYFILPRVLRDVSHIDCSVQLLGQTVSSPIQIAPTAMQRMAHPEGEIATAQGEKNNHRCIVFLISFEFLILIVQ